MGGGGGGHFMPRMRWGQKRGSFEHLRRGQVAGADTGREQVTHVKGKKRQDEITQEYSQEFGF